MHPLMAHLPRQDLHGWLHLTRSTFKLHPFPFGLKRVGPPTSWRGRFDGYISTPSATAVTVLRVTKEHAHSRNRYPLLHVEANYHIIIDLYQLKDSSSHSLRSTLTHSMFVRLQLLTA